MTEKAETPSLKSVVGALLLAAKQPLTTSQIRNTLKSTAGTYGEQAAGLDKMGEKAIRTVIGELKEDLDKGQFGMRVVEVANGFRLQNDPACGIWLRQMLDRGKPQRLSKPALETLAVIAYRQPCTRSEVEAVRGVSVDAMVRTLLEMGLIKVTGRSELPGRPWLFGSTNKFLEHFGINAISELPGAEELRRREEQLQAAEASGEAAGEAADEGQEVPDEPAPEGSQEAAPVDAPEAESDPEPDPDEGAGSEDNGEEE